MKMMFHDKVTMMAQKKIFSVMLSLDVYCWTMVCTYLFAQALEQLLEQAVCVLLVELKHQLT